MLHLLVSNAKEYRMIPNPHHPSLLRAIGNIMSTLFYPIITFFLLAICIAYWAVTAMYPMRPLWVEIVSSDIVNEMP